MHPQAGVTVEADVQAATFRRKAIGSRGGFNRAKTKRPVELLSVKSGSEGKQSHKNERDQ